MLGAQLPTVQVQGSMLLSMEYLTWHVTEAVWFMMSSTDIAEIEILIEETKPNGATGLHTVSGA